MGEMRLDNTGDAPAARKRVRGSVQALAVAVLLVAAAAGWQFRDRLLGGGSTEARQGGRPVAVDVAPATAGTVVRAVEAVGTVIANQAIDVVPRVTGTVAQIVFACVVLASLGFKFNADGLIVVLMGLVAALTLLSVAAYVREWVRHMNSAAAGL